MEYGTTANEKKKRRTPRGARGRDGALTFSQPALESSVFCRIRPKFPNNCGAGQPIPQHPIGEEGKYETTADEAKNRGTPRNATARHGELKFGQPALKSTAFWRNPPKFPNIFGSGNPLPQRLIGGGGQYETTESERQNAAPRGALQNAKEL